MNLEVYDSKQNDDTVFLKLSKVGLSVIVQVVDQSGIRIDRGDLIEFKLNGKMYRHRDVNPRIGFSLDAAGRIEETV